jgi:hypothetical protein
VSNGTSSFSVRSPFAVLLAIFPSDVMRARIAATSSCPTTPSHATPTTSASSFDRNASTHSCCSRGTRAKRPAARSAETKRKTSSSASTISTNAMTWAVNGVTGVFVRDGSFFGGAGTDNGAAAAAGGCSAAGAPAPFGSQYVSRTRTPWPGARLSRAILIGAWFSDFGSSTISEKCSIGPGRSVGAKSWSRRSGAPLRVSTFVSV